MIDFAGSDVEKQRPFLAVNVSETFLAVQLSSKMPSSPPYGFSESSSNKSVQYLLPRLPYADTSLSGQARLIKGIDLDELEYTTFDGWGRLEPQYSV